MRMSTRLSRSELVSHPHFSGDRRTRQRPVSSKLKTSRAGKPRPCWRAGAPEHAQRSLEFRLRCGARGQLPVRSESITLSCCIRPSVSRSVDSFYSVAVIMMSSRYVFVEMYERRLKIHTDAFWSQCCPVDPTSTQGPIVDTCLAGMRLRTSATVRIHFLFSIRCADWAQR